LLETGASAPVEPNVTTYDQAPRFEVFAAIGRKRSAA
jgi:hypothetical protein